jgi:hypothetical protein
MSGIERTIAKAALLKGIRTKIRDKLVRRAQRRTPASNASAIVIIPPCSDMSPGERIYVEGHEVLRMIRPP